MKIVFTGPESSGKTYLSTLIAKMYSFGYVKEMAREYLEKRNNRYDYECLIDIAKHQVDQEERVRLDYSILCCDTDLLTIIVWSEEKYKKVDHIILDLWRADFPDLYFLCSPDIPWEFDPQRENQHDRERLFNIYKNKLISNNLPFHIIYGEFESRISMVVNIIDHIILKPSLR